MTTWFKPRKVIRTIFTFNSHHSAHLLPKGRALPQTISNLQTIMARDAELMLEMDKELKELRNQNQRLRERLAKRQ